MSRTFLYQGVDARLRRDQDCSADHEDIFELVFTQHVGVPREGVVVQAFERAFRVGVHRFLYGVRVFEVLDLAVDRNVAVSNPDLAAYPREFVNAALIYRTFSGVTQSYVVGDRVVAEAVQARVVFRHYVYVECNCVVRFLSTTITKYPRRRLRVGRVIRGNVIEPSVLPFFYAEPAAGYSGFEVVGFCRLVNDASCYSLVEEIQRGSRSVAVTTVRRRARVIIGELAVNRVTWQDYVIANLFFGTDITYGFVVVP